MAAIAVRPLPPPLPPPRGSAVLSAPPVPSLPSPIPSSASSPLPPLPSPIPSPSPSTPLTPPTLPAPRQSIAGSPVIPTLVRHYFEPYFGRAQCSYDAFRDVEISVNHHDFFVVLDVREEGGIKWYRVTTESGLTGWIPDKVVEGGKVRTTEAEIRQGEEEAKQKKIDDEKRAIEEAKMAVERKKKADADAIVQAAKRAAEEEELRQLAEQAAIAEAKLAPIRNATDTKLLQMEAIESKTRELIGGWEDSTAQAQDGVMMEALLAKYKALLESLRTDLKRFKGSEANNYKTVYESNKQILFALKNEVSFRLSNAGSGSNDD